MGENRRIGIREAARLLGLREQAVRLMVQRGELKGTYMKQPGGKKGAYYLYLHNVLRYRGDIV